MRPKTTDLCGICKHGFGDHFTAYGGKTGCANVFRDQRDGDTRCGCAGFAVIWKDQGQGEVSGYGWLDR